MTALYENTIVTWLVDHCIACY